MLQKSKLYGKLYDGRFEVLKVNSEINMVRIQNIYNKDIFAVPYTTFLRAKNKNTWIKKKYQLYRRSITE